MLQKVEHSVGYCAVCLSWKVGGCKNFPNSRGLKMNFVGQRIWLEIKVKRGDKRNFPIHFQEITLYLNLDSSFLIPAMCTCNIAGIIRFFHRNVAIPRASTQTASGFYVLTLKQAHEASAMVSSHNLRGLAIKLTCIS